jgi:cell division transport system permease protein
MMNRVMFAIGEALKGFYRRAFVTWLSISTMAVALFFMGIFTLIAYNIHIAFRDVAGSAEIEIFLHTGTSNRDALAFRESLSKESWIGSIKYIDSDEARLIFERRFGAELLEGLDENPIPPSFRIELAEGLELADVSSYLDATISNVDIVESTFTPTEMMRNLERIRKIFVIIVIVWGAIIFFLSVIVVTNTIKLATDGRRDTIAIMQLVGSDRAFIRMPFLIEGFLAGMISGMIAVVAVYGVMKLDRFIAYPIATLPDVVLVAIVVAGALFGTVGARIAVDRYL